MMRRACRCLTFGVVAALWAAPARAELVFFASGQSLNVRAHHIDGESLVLSLRSGGEIRCPAASIARIEPDEVPWVEPAGEVRLKPEPTPDPARSGYEPIIQRVAAEQGVNAELVRAVIQVESAYQPRARSPRGAVGLMQVMPETARQYGVKNLYDPESNIEAGIKHLKSLLDRLPLSLALAAYNAGEAAVQRFRGIPPYPETRNYVASVLRLVNR